MRIKPRQSLKAAFTLTELMIVVAIIGILAAIAVPSMIKYVRKSRTAEAISNIGAIQTFEEAYYAENDQYVSTVKNPATLPTNGTKQAFNSGLDGWSALGRVVPNSRLLTFQYQVSGGSHNGTAFTFCPTDGSACGTTALTAHHTSSGCTKIGNTTGGSIAVSDPTLYGVPAVLNTAWFVITAIGSQDADTECSLFVAQTDRPDITEEQPIE